MIRITKGQANLVVVTTTEKGTAAHYAQVKLTLEGEWSYTIYGQASASNLNPTGLTVLETGMCIVTGTTTATPTYTGNDNQLISVYNG